MLRAAVLVLVLANAGYYAWAQGLLRGWGLGPAEQSEPQRLEQQIRPESLRIGRPAGGDAATGTGTGAPAPAAVAPAAAAPAAGPSTAEATASAPVAAETHCLQAGPFEARQADVLRTAAATVLPAGTWSLETLSVTGRWMVYMGRFPDEEALEKKRAELRARKVPYDRPGTALEPGLSLGRFTTEEAAERALALLGTQGVRTARVVQERFDTTSHVLRLPAATPALRTQAETQLRTALAGKPLRACG
ncbi:SPOR domain-containing protein [Acidovorax sp. NCPPB 4044]|uniref:SPOR domain-containing protein n=1 Tax=Acidovorax sp. NCPPB 4044 TaxID=2940490 RepID=UPI002303EF74|nr:SPOR domain-containing protein [Acidovorax sp. NCPPB 4044]MDA8523527.1 SPOR domain-containing protein [Acidovorax sp. NCPPB 4044]